MSVHPPTNAVADVVARALAEDLGPDGDITASLVPDDSHTSARLVAREPGVLAGRMCADEAFSRVDPHVKAVWLRDDGDRIATGDVLATVDGPTRALLTAERTALNLLGHLSGVATLTRRYVEAATAANPACAIRDTRKTTPGLRALEKAAVRAGGGVNHRSSLSEEFLVKDNHLGAVGIIEAVARARESFPDRRIEVECDRINQVSEAVDAGVPIVLLDNMTPAQVAECVALVAGRCLVEVSGGITLETVTAYAAAGPDYISVGALTHSAPSLDIGLDL
ncbi:MAG TPA: carboxylating nicotinate-nucleotide diphosphorylase [Acidimicrobiales bacterium]|nr:carboxylating nicotinate-nucleotide diphosphorylase [Acidimicrobiales bacterium]